MDRRRSTRLLDAIYGMDPRAPDWTPLLTQLAAAFRARLVALQVYDTHLRRHRLTESAGPAGDVLAACRDALAQHPWFERGVDAMLAQGIANDGLLTTDDSRPAARVRPDAMPPDVIAHGLALCLHPCGPHGLSVLTINRGADDGRFDETERTLARSLLPHLRNVCALQQRVGWLEGESQRLRTTLDQLSKGVAMLDTCGHLLFCNRAAEQMEARGLFARHPDHRLALPHAADEHQLRQVLDGLAAGTATPPKLLQIHSRTGRLRAMLKLCRADNLAGTLGTDADARVIAFFKPLELAADTSLVPTLGSQWGFTPAEARLAQRLMEGLSLDEAAECTHVTKNTVRTQLRSLFDKTDTRRQSQLVRVLLELSYM